MNLTQTIHYVAEKVPERQVQRIREMYNHDRQQYGEEKTLEYLSVYEFHIWQIYTELSQCVDLYPVDDRQRFKRRVIKRVLELSRNWRYNPFLTGGG